ncbi:MAG TPA: M48 family metallopeptidase [Mycobacteriales bacterium]|nr:M48 family metallopeptidase [Mycobacteriales bacterium]
MRLGWSGDPGAEPDPAGIGVGAGLALERSRWSGRRGAALGAAGFGVALVAFVVVTTPWTVLPAPVGGRTPVRVRDDFTATQLATENAFHHAVQPWSYAALLAGLAVSAVLGLTPAGGWLVRVVARPFGGGWAWQVGLGGVALAAVGQLTALPFAVHNERVFRRYGVSTQDWSAWAADVGRGFGLDVGLTAVALIGFYALVRLAPRTWWAWTALSGATLVIAVSFAYPVLVEPLFTRFHPMGAGPLRSSLLSLAHRDGVRVTDVLVADASARTTSLNAYVSGFGGTRHIVVYDTLLRDATPGQVRLIVAHELGHAKRDDVGRGTLIGALGVGLACCLGYLLLGSQRLRRRAGAGSTADPRSLALVLFLLAAGTLAATPVESLISRRVEARADVHSLNLTGDPRTFEEMQVKLSVSNLSDLDPNPIAYALFADHPTGPERIALAHDWARLHGVPDT